MLNRVKKLNTNSLVKRSNFVLVQRNSRKGGEELVDQLATPFFRFLIQLSIIWFSVLCVLSWTNIWEFWFVLNMGSGGIPFLYWQCCDLWGCFFFNLIIVPFPFRVGCQEKLMKKRENGRGCWILVSMLFCQVVMFFDYDQVMEFDLELLTNKVWVTLD